MSQRQATAQIGTRRRSKPDLFVLGCSWTVSQKTLKALDLLGIQIHDDLGTFRRLGGRCDMHPQLPRARPDGVQDSLVSVL